MQFFYVYFRFASAITIPMTQSTEMNSILAHLLTKHDKKHENEVFEALNKNTNPNSELKDEKDSTDLQNKHENVNHNNISLYKLSMYEV